MLYDIVRLTAVHDYSGFSQGEVTGYAVIDVDYDTYSKLS